MKRLVWRGSDKFEFEEVAGPGESALAPNQVLIRVKAVGICRTDIHILEGRFPNVRPPLVLGHEIAGIVEEVGRNVSRVTRDDRVTCDSVVGCGQCSFCLKGKRQFCLNGFEFGFSENGGCQEFLILPEENVYPIRDSISMEEAAILDMEVFAALKKPGVKRGDKVLIIGAGPAGLVATQIAKVFGADKVLLSGRSDWRLKLGHHLGADRTINVGRDNAREIIAFETGGMGADLVIDCAGTSESFDEALESATPGGRVVLYGIYPEFVSRCRILKIVLKDLCVFGALSDRRGWEEVISLVEEKRLKLKELITHTFPFRDAALAYKFVQNGSDDFVKVVLQL